MSFMDKVKAQAAEAMVKAQAGVAQGQAKLDTMQVGKQQSDLLRALGSAVYAEKRQGGSSDAVTAALTALDEFTATQGAIDLTAPSPTTSAGPVAGPPAAAAPAAGTPSGDFTL